ncbi:MULTISPECIES: hypothetical protein [unclassified Pseudoclavibacter]|uniref:hypothetical protein n=1 Tax=unclassified Pseudoclavibacter TaxID=2615177 RepID=UPI0012F1C11D|nr:MULTISPECIES: hypothetical protein [unclassified Pseudoclavibacter]MBF4460183.1 hypothetical protein [Pseudoclavibacter sp. VKM Ac-2867]VXC26129.1 conserved hypothetical protein [Pseudoclavibacter sp. 8L]
MSIAATAPGGAAQRGTTRLTAKALNRLVSAVAGDALGVDAGSVSVDLDDHNGKLALRLSTPIRVPSLARIREQPSSISRSGGPLLERVETAKTTIRDRVQTLSGSSISAVTIRLTGLEIKPEERVR